MTMNVKIGTTAGSPESLYHFRTCKFQFNNATLFDVILLFCLWRLWLYFSNNAHWGVGVLLKRAILAENALHFI